MMVIIMVVVAGYYISTGSAEWGNYLMLGAILAQLITLTRKI